MAAAVVFTFVGGVAAAAVSKALAEELKAWTPKITRKLVAFAVARLPEEQKGRFSEEWSSYVAEFPGNIAKIISALGLVLAAFRIGLAARPARRSRIVDRLKEAKEGQSWGGLVMRHRGAVYLPRLVALTALEIQIRYAPHVAPVWLFRLAGILGPAMGCILVLAFVLEVALICLRRVMRLPVQKDR
jgi:hypothetical protein